MSDAATLVLGTDCWLTMPAADQDVVLLTRARLSRNFAGWRFPHHAEPEERAEVAELMQNIAVDDRLIDEVFPGGGVLVPNELDIEERLFLEENFQMSRELAVNPWPEQLFLTDGRGNGGIFVNGSNHLNITWLATGWQPFRALGEAMRIEQEVVRRSIRPFSFDSKLGYLTAHASEVGTGLRISVLLHLPGMSIMRRVKSLRQKAADRELLLTEYRRQNAALWVLRNTATLGRTEEELIMNINSFLEELIESERVCRTRAFRAHSLLIRDQVSRALSLCAGCHLLEAEEGTNLLSAMRMGIASGMIQNLNHGPLNTMMVQMQPGHVSMLSGINLPEPPPKRMIDAARQPNAIQAMRYAKQIQHLDSWRAQTMRRVRSTWNVQIPENDDQ